MDSHLESMFREVAYLKEKRNVMLQKAIRLGWTSDIIKTICVLSVFNHYVIGPLSTSGKRFCSGSLENVASIQHGSMLLNEHSAISINESCREFYNIVMDLSINLNILHSVSVRDIVYYISKDNENEGN